MVRSIASNEYPFHSNLCKTCLMESEFYCFHFPFLLNHSRKVVKSFLCFKLIKHGSFQKLCVCEAEYTADELKIN